MREIIFRGRGKYTGVWIYGDLLREIDSSVTIYGVHPSNGSLDNHPVKVGTIGQYTGMNDKNGVPIYEGDRILYNNSLEQGEGVVSFHLGFNIEWDLSTVVTERPSIMSPLFYFGCEKEIEVIGSIYT